MDTWVHFFVITSLIVVLVMRTSMRYNLKVVKQRDYDLYKKVGFDRYPHPDMVVQDGNLNAFAEYTKSERLFSSTTKTALYPEPHLTLNSVQCPTYNDLQSLPTSCNNKTKPKYFPIYSNKLQSWCDYQWMLASLFS